MKIAIISGEIPAPTFVERLVSGLAAHHHVFLLGKKKGRSAPRNNVQLLGVVKKNERLHSRWLAVKYRLFLQLFRPSDLRKINKTVKHPNYDVYALVWHKPDVLHVQWAKAVDHFLWVQEFGIKLVVSLRGAHINYSPLADEQLAAVYRKAFPKVDAFHGVSQAICREAAHYGADLAKCKVVYSGFDVQQFPQPSPRKPLGSKPLSIVSVGRAHWKKGYHYALDAMHAVKQTGLSFTYHIVGVGQDEELAFQLDQLALSDCVTFGQSLPFSKVLDTVRNADVFLLPSVEEGIANVVIEAMLLGTPVITTNCGGMEELVQNGVNGLVVPVRNPYAIADAIAQFNAMSIDAINDMQMAAYTKACSQHNTQKMVDGMHRVYTLALDGHA